MRVLHRLPGDWRTIHEFVTKNWPLAEPAVAYVAADDDGKRYAVLECQVRVHPRGYRAVHYLLPCGGEDHAQWIELQVNTLFEEAWSEVDHATAYPECAVDRGCTELLEVLDHLARAGDVLAARVTHLGEEASAIREDDAARITRALASFRRAMSE